MFLNIQRFTRLMKEAYKRKLTVGNLDDGIVMSSGYWAVWLDNQHVPNKIKAAIMELAGEIPEPGVLFEISKGEPNPQIVIEGQLVETLRNLIHSVENVDKKVIVSPIVLHKSKPIRLLKGSGQIIGVAEDYYQVIDKTVINYDIEGEPTGPVNRGKASGALYWYNSICTLVVMPFNLEQHDEILTALSKVDFKEADKQ